MSPQLGTKPFTSLDLSTFMCQILLHGYLHGWHFYTVILHTWVHFYTGILENDKGLSVVLQMSSQLSTAPLTGLDQYHFCVKYLANSISISNTLALLYRNTGMTRGLLFPVVLQMSPQLSTAPLTGLDHDHFCVKYKYT